MDIATRIQQLEDMIREAKSMPLSASALLNREELLEVVGSLKDALPEEIKQARWVVKDREELLSKARRDAEALVEKARSDQAHMLSDEAVVQKAQDEAERILAAARDQVRQMRLEAEDYVDGKLAQFDAVLTKIQEALTGADESLTKVRGQVEAGRDKLRGSHPAQALAPEEVGGAEEPR
jgi:cell division septum initiation protein DivIVA